LTRTVHLQAGTVDLGNIVAPIAGSGTGAHSNKFGEPYDKETPSPY